MTVIPNLRVPPPPEPPQEDEHDPLWPDRLLNGGSFIFDIPEVAPSLWGRGDEVLWPQGEALMLAGPPGVGKTTLAQQVVRARLGLADTVLGYPVRRTGSRLLYLAMDRPAQIARSFRRGCTPNERAALDERLVVWKGPPPADMAVHPSTLLTLAREAGADTVVVDSLKDAALGLTDDEKAAGWNRARQTALAADVEVLELHHMVKRGPNGQAPKELADVYGSAWLTAGLGSVLLLWGAAGDPLVELRHLKPAQAEVGPLKVLHNHEHGTSTVSDGVDLVDLAAKRRGGLTAKDAAAAITDSHDPSRNEVEKARRKLDALARQGLLHRRDGHGGGAGGGEPTTYVAVRRP